MIALSLGPAGPNTRHGTKKRRKPSVLVPESRNSQSRKECGQIEAPIERKLQHTASRKRIVSEASSDRAAKSAMCSRGSSRVKELEAQLDMALQAKERLAAQIKEHKIISAQSTLEHLEEYFTCPLCVPFLRTVAVVTEASPDAA